MKPRAPRQVFSIIEHLHRSRTIAEQVAAGRFAIQGTALDLGVEPDWIGAALPADREWRLEWSKFYYGLDLAWAFQETGDIAFQRTWERLVRSWIRQVPIEFDPTDVIGRRIQNWIYAWNGFAAGDAFAGLENGLADAIVESVAAQASYLRQHLTRERNHRTLELYALLIAALGLPEIDSDGALLQFALTELYRNLMSDVQRDGVQREGSTHYHHVALRSFLGARENAARFGLAVPDGYDHRLSCACEFALHTHRPDGSIPALSDADTGSYLDLLELAARVLSRPDWLYVATRGARGVVPHERNVSFPIGGYFVQRSGWGDRSTPLTNERFAIFDCGPLGDGGHGHYDQLNVEIAAEGRPLVMDPGRYTYCDDPPHWRRWFKSTAAHNTVAVDGLDQTPYRRGKPKGAVARGRLLQRLQGDGLDVLWGEAQSPLYEPIHRRRLLFAGDEYWIIEDLLDGTTPHRYDLRFHLAPEAWNLAEITTHDSTVVVRAPGVALIFLAPHPVHLEPGWIAPRYGTKLPAPVAAASVDRVARAEFLTCVLPLAADHPLPRVRVDRVGTCRSRVTVVAIIGVGNGQAFTDRIAWSGSGEPVDIAAIGQRAAAAWCRRTHAGELVRLAIGEQVDVDRSACAKATVDRSAFAEATADTSIGASAAQREMLR